MSRPIGFIDPDWLVAQYATRSAEDIARELGIGATTVLRQLRALGCPLRPPGHQRGQALSLATRTKISAAALGRSRRPRGTAKPRAPRSPCPCCGQPLPLFVAHRLGLPVPGEEGPRA